MMLGLIRWLYKVRIIIIKKELKENLPHNSSGFCRFSDILCTLVGPFAGLILFHGSLSIFSFGKELRSGFISYFDNV
jgi:hypothetical protein